MTKVTSRMVHHGAAASSSSHCIVWLPPSSSMPCSQIVYASHGLLNICQRRTVKLGETKESVWSVFQTLRTSMATVDSAKRVITSLAYVGESLLCGFSNGSITAWRCENSAWNEQPIVMTDAGRAITHLDGHYFAKEKRWIVITCSSDGAHLLHFTNSFDSPLVSTRVASFTANVVRVQAMPFGNVLILIGTAAPRHNKIHVYMMAKSTDSLLHCGSLTGHEDWMTCLAWNSSQTLLASGSQDAKIRLWEFTTSAEVTEGSMPLVSEDDDSDAQVDDLLDDDEDDEEGEARLELCHEQGVTRVTLEALLFGHEEAVTSVHWHPNPMPLYRQEDILISSSMDRTLLIWSPFTGVWTPLTRVGSAGGILGGSIGSTLLGFVHAAVEPVTGESLVGHAFGGALHVWSVEQETNIGGVEELSLEDLALRNKWKAMPCVTGHFESVTDLCWEAERGDYLLTVSTDQTCRLWAPVPALENDEDMWVEMARPQIHGYDLAAVTSVSTEEHRHLFVSGADEKEARVFDAPMSTLRLLQAACGKEAQMEKETSRVERAYIPSLGLSQKASAVDEAEVDTSNFDTTLEESQLRLPLERDLGAVSLWPEMRKLYGHNTELFCLTSTVSACSGPKFASSPFANDVLVASSSKARDVDAAAIRLWDVENGKCVQVLSGGHKSTVAALCFSPDGSYLASSGKDRRLCFWHRNESALPSFSLASAIDSAHKRIVWGLNFCPFDPSMLASGSRDGCVKIWKISGVEGDRATPTISEIHSFEPSTRIGAKAESVTALAFAPRVQENAVLALGLECGFIELWSVPTVETSKCQLLFLFPNANSHIATVNKLAWRPLHDDDENDADGSSAAKLTLASCGMDHGCRVFELEFS